MQPSGVVTAIIRAGTVSDRDAILALVEKAFSDPTRDGLEEVNIVTETWRREASPQGLDWY